MIRTTVCRVPGVVWRKGEARKMSEGFLSSMSNRGKDGWINFFPRRWEGCGEELGGFERVGQWERDTGLGAAGVWWWMAREGCKNVAGGLLRCCPECPRTSEAGLLCTGVQVGPSKGSRLRACGGFRIHRAVGATSRWQPLGWDREPL